MAYKVIILYQLYMPSYFLGTFTEYPYVDSIGCTACKLNFYDWYQKINSLGKITDLAFLFYVNTKNFKILIHQII